MKKRILILLLTILLYGYSAFAETIVGVTSFSNLSKNTKYTWLEVGIADSVSYKLRNVQDYIVIDRTNIDKVLGEIQLGQSGVIDENMAKKAGKALNADVLVVGSFAIAGNSVRINAKLVEVESHKILKQVQATGMIDDIFSLQDQIALNLVEKQDVQISSETRERMTERYTQNLSAYEYYTKGQQFYYQANYTKAIELFDKAASIDKNYSLAYAGLGKAYASLYWQQKNYSNLIEQSLLEKSFKFSEKAIKISPNLDEAHLSMAKYYQNVDTAKIPDNWQKCEEITKKVLEINPNNGEAYFLMSRIYGYDDAKEEMYLKQAIAKNDFIADAHNNLGIIYTDQGKYDLAKRSFQKAIKVDPEYLTAYMNIGVVYDKEGKYEESLEMYKTIVGKYPKYPLGLVNLGIGYRRLERYDEAMVYFKRAVEVKPDYAFGWGEVAYIHLQKKNYKEAIKTYKTALKYEPKNKYSLANIGYCYVQIEDYNNAIANLKLCADTYSDYDWPAGELGWVYRWKLNNNAEALRWYQEASRRDPSNKDYKQYIGELSN
jgi:tetratricopeptide (TPR) repeat protein